MKKKLVNLKHFLVTFIAVCLSASIIYAQEHPSEHPSEHPAEHPGTKEKASLTIDDLSLAIETYIEKETKLKGGYFLIYDAKAKKPLALTLDRVHKERLSNIGGGVYFACADFKTSNGKVYYLDVFMEGSSKDNLKVTDISVHKEAGKPRYAWYEEGGVWKKKSVR